jgi:hypothetical protein
MSPEAPGNLVAIDVRFEQDGLRAKVDRVLSRSDDFMEVSWYGREAPEGALSVGGGVAYVFDKDQLKHRTQQSADVQRHNGECLWRDTALGDGLMFILVLPPGYTIKDPEPMLREAKAFDGRVAVYWKPEEQHGASVLFRWQLVESDQDLDAAVNLINHLILDAAKVPSNPGVNVNDVNEPILEVKVKVKNLLNNRFSVEELDTICFELGIDAENLKGFTKEAKAREMVIYLDNRGRLSQLIAVARARRPALDWPSAELP